MQLIYKKKWIIGFSCLNNLSLNTLFGWVYFYYQKFEKKIYTKKIKKKIKKEEKKMGKNIKDKEIGD